MSGRSTAPASVGAFLCVRRESFRGAVGGNSESSSNASCCALETFSPWFAARGSFVAFALSICTHPQKEIGLQSARYP